jgi:ATP-dependent Zn protease
MKNNRRYSAAIHEAAHAIIGRVLGQTCGSATIEINEEEREAGHSICADPYQTAADWDRGGRFRNMSLVMRGRILTYMAGAEAEAVLLGACGVGDGHDRQQIEWMADSSDSGFSPEQWIRSEPRMRATCRMLIRRHRERIEAVAAALIERRNLTAAEIDRLTGFESILLDQAGSAACDRVGNDDSLPVRLTVFLQRS